MSLGWWIATVVILLGVLGMAFLSMLYAADPEGRGWAQASALIAGAAALFVCDVVLVVVAVVRRVMSP